MGGVIPLQGVGIQYKMKEEILRIIKKERNISGEELGKRLGISRSAVWKHINGLRKMGYVIDSCPRKGYSLVSTPDLLIPEEINQGLKTNRLGKEIIYFKETSSTQEIAKKLALDGKGEGGVIIAESQRSGRGRMGRSWYSPPGYGIYFSLILRPHITPSDAIKIPLVTSIAVASAIREITSLNACIKWPNDIMVNNKKTGGILVESASEMDIINYMIVGIGVNINTPDELIPGELKEIATSLYIESGRRYHRIRLFQEILKELEINYEEFLNNGFNKLRTKWMELSNTIGMRVIINTPGEPPFEGLAQEIDIEGALIVALPDGSIKRVISGDVSLRHMN